MTVGTAASIRLTDEPALAGLCIAIQVTPGAAAARVAGARADTRGRRPVRAAGFLALALGAVLAALAVESDCVVVLVLAAALFGIGTSLVTSAVADHSPTEPSRSLATARRHRQTVGGSGCACPMRERGASGPSRTEPLSNPPVRAAR